jgi:hypothetical protein
VIYKLFLSPSQRKGSRQSKIPDYFAASVLSKRLVFIFFSISNLNKKLVRADSKSKMPVTVNLNPRKIGLPLKIPGLIVNYLIVQFSYAAFI